MGYIFRSFDLPSGECCGVDPAVTIRYTLLLDPLKDLTRLVPVLERRRLEVHESARFRKTPQVTPRRHVGVDVRHVDVNLIPLLAEIVYVLIP